MALRAVLADGRWAEGRRVRDTVLIGATTFGILALELGLIRWTSSQIRAFAYFNNLVLIGAFLGMGLGVALGRRLPGLLHGAVPLLLLVSVVLGFSEDLGLVHLSFPDRTVMLWGGAVLRANFAVFFTNLSLFVAIFTTIVAVFVCCGVPLGYLFARMPVLRAYNADLLGSLLGIVAFAGVAWLQAGPVVWLALGVVPIVWVARSWVAAIGAVLVLVLAHISVRGAVFSPYNRIDVHSDPLSIQLDVNRDFHQNLHDFSEQRLADPRLTDYGRETLRDIREIYDLPFKVNANRRSAVVVGAGTGNDVQAALRNGYQSVTSVDIDTVIMSIGRERHPEKPYADPRVRGVVNDARAFFGRETGTFDLVCYGLLDSHAMSSAMSTLRLDNYVYTEEGIRSAWERVGPGGHLSLAISCAAGEWFFERLYWTIAKATGREPVALFSPFHGNMVTYMVARDGVVLDPAEIGKRPQLQSKTPRDRMLTPSDDWPFLYVRPGVFPWGYLAVLTFVLTLAALTVPRAFAAAGEGGGKSFDGVLFFMGAAFLLIEARGVTSMSLLFGSTWVVNAAIFAGILTMVLLANLAEERWQWTNPTPWFIALFAATAVLCFFPTHVLQGLPLLGRAAAAGLITGLPVGIAGVIVPMLLQRAAQPAAALGSNLLGAVIGGCLEYYSMFAGLRATALMALVLYLVAYLLLQRKRPVAAAGGATPAHA
ncbi:MAG: hypothetical protein V4773_11725 [Verrucomicrobiota bacterium]